MELRIHSINALLPKTRSMQIAAALVLVAALLGLVALRNARAVAPSNEHFQRTWERTDKPIIDGVVSRTWNWGPQGISNEISEPYGDAPGGSRRVQYFDKSRMEINDPAGDPNDARGDRPWCRGPVTRHRRPAGEPTATRPSATGFVARRTW